MNSFDIAHHTDIRIRWCMGLWYEVVLRFHLTPCWLPSWIPVHDGDVGLRKYANLISDLDLTPERCDRRRQTDDTEAQKHAGHSELTRPATPKKKTKKKNPNSVMSDTEETSCPNQM